MLFPDYWIAEDCQSGVVKRINDVKMLKQHGIQKRHARGRVVPGYHATTRCFPALYNDSQKLSLRLRLCVFNKSEFHRLRQAIMKPKPL